MSYGQYSHVGIGQFSVESTRGVDSAGETGQAQTEPGGYVYGATLARAAWQGSGEQPPCLAGQEDAASTTVQRYVSYLENPAGMDKDSGDDCESNGKRKLGDRTDPEEVVQSVAVPAQKISVYCGRCVVQKQCDVRDAVAELTAKRESGKRHNQKS